jgi:hypothetical protein
VWEYVYKRPAGRSLLSCAQGRSLVSCPVRFGRQCILQKAGSKNPL